jgi:hypothetical protein
VRVVPSSREAVGLAERALALGPASAVTLSQCGWTHVYVGQPDRALGLLERAVRADPLDPMGYSGLAAMAHGHIQLGQDEAAIAAAAIPVPVAMSSTRVPEPRRPRRSSAGAKSRGRRPNTRS